MPTPKPLSPSVSAPSVALTGSVAQAQSAELSDLDLYAQVRAVLAQARQSVQCHVNQVMVQSYW